MENSEILLNRAMEFLDEVSIGENNWDVGGGTVLSQIYNHRLSKDIDIFVNDVQLIGNLSPRFNEPEGLIGYDEDSAYVSLRFKEGKIDFIASPHLTSFEPQRREFFNHNVLTEDPIEIVTKKVYHRGYMVRARDLFDLAIVYNSDRRLDLINSMLKYQDKFNVFKSAFAKSLEEKTIDVYSVMNKDMLLPEGMKIYNKEIDICKDFIEHVNSIQQILNYSGEHLKDKNKEIFFNTAKSILKENQIPKDFSRQIMDSLSRQYSLRKVKDIIKYSPIAIDRTQNKILDR